MSREEQRQSQRRKNEQLKQENAELRARIAQLEDENARPLEQLNKQGSKPTGSHMKQSLLPNDVYQQGFRDGRKQAYEILSEEFFQPVSWYHDFHFFMIEIAARVHYSRDLWRNTPDGRRIYIVNEKDAGDLTKYYIQLKMVISKLCIKHNVPKDEYPDIFNPKKMIDGIHDLISGIDDGKLLREAVEEYKPITSPETIWSLYLPKKPGPVKKSRAIDRLVAHYDAWRDLGCSGISATNKISSYFSEPRIWTNEEKEERELFDQWNKAGTAEDNLRKHSSNRAKKCRELILP